MTVSMNFKSESLTRLEKSEEAKMSNVLDALKLGQVVLAEELFSRVSKKVVSDRVEQHRSTSIAKPAQVKRSMMEEVNIGSDTTLHMTEKRIISLLDNARLASDLELMAYDIGEELGHHIPGKTTLFLVDSLSVSISALDRDMWSFILKQKFYAR